ncbi:MAG: peptidoglycan DD-metalloendopeptidase family protein [Saprospiraceae bacterium]|nr:peptidoglycan DD-metalloendopeptidase family protein [Bacteroidia bacterium]NNE16504.1 peptidoglycan DD-metalloendopeptidase family protein [Saprospiraceae bacterium]NNL90909.1 peptidoglycan DD-metalloendopeptidase family protein [Saprospiraceae bacterium]
MKQKESLAVNISICICLILAGIFLFNRCNNSTQINPDELVSVVLPEKKFGYEKDKYHFETYNLSSNQTLGSLLLYQGIPWDSILKLDKVSKDKFSIRRFRAKKPFTLVKEDSCAAPCCLVYEPNKLTYIKYHLKDKIEVDVIKKRYEVCEEQASGEIESSLWMAMKKSGLGFEIIDKMEDALASSVDFYHAQKGDQFKLIFERKYIDGVPVEFGEILAAAYKNDYGEQYSVYFENDNYSGFYDLKGQPTKKTFLRAPLKYSRISSRFNPRRFHPIKKRRIPHLGTDYAAPIGTPIYAVADGVVEVAGYAKNNGKYVKIRHDDVYKTQYLHMHRFSKGIKKGVRVKQGQQIGEVGQTGLATGPHVCYRFWKHGRQVNHLRENFPPKDPLPESELPEFFKQRDLLLTRLSLVPYPDEKRESNILEMDIQT